MSLEVRVEQLESHFDSLDSAVRSLIKITGDTHQIVLDNQRENRLRFQQIEQRFDQQDREITELRSSLAALIDATHAGFKRSDEKIDQLELLIRQSLPTN